jgi:hypothetical protein
MRYFALNSINVPAAVKPLSDSYRLVIDDYAVGVFSDEVTIFLGDFFHNLLIRWVKGAFYVNAEAGGTVALLLKRNGAG